MSKDFYLTVACTSKRCQATPGYACVDKYGKELPASQSHKARVDAYEARQAAEHDNAVAQQADFDVAKAQAKAMETFAKEQREDKIGHVLFAIRFGREIMHMSQAQLDRRMAEMMVDGGYEAVMAMQVE